MNAGFYVNQLHLQAHPEGGYFKETYRADENIPASALPSRFTEHRSFSTSIYYLLEKGDYSAFHRIKSDECWHFYAGGPLLIHMIKEEGNYFCIKLGNSLEKGEKFQFVVPAAVWFAAEPAENTVFSLVGCTVAPGFDFNDFEMADEKQMLSSFPDHSDVINRLCRKRKQNIPD